MRPTGDARRANNVWRVGIVTAIRSEYDILYSVLRAIDAHPALEYLLVVTGAHLSHAHGYTVREIEADGWRIAARLETLLSADTGSARARGAASQLAGLVDVFSAGRPDMLLAMGDREEALTVAAAGRFMGIPVAHLSAGDSTPGAPLDEALRYAASALADLYLCISPGSADRLRARGYPLERIHVVGNAGLDRLLTVPEMSRGELGAALGFDLGEGPLLLVIQHPVPGQEAAAQMRATIQAVADLGYTTLISYPNSDAGREAIVGVIEQEARPLPHVHVYQNLARAVFVNLLRQAAVLVGNSSSGITEAPLLRLPVVNIGARQVGREHADNVLFVPHEAGAIAAAIEQALSDAAFKAQVAACANPYGDGHSGARIAALLADAPPIPSPSSIHGEGSRLSGEVSLPQDEHSERGANESPVQT